MREALERDDVAVVDRVSKGVVKRTELSQIMLPTESARPSSHTRLAL
jgi:hypothetical protein